MDVTKYVNSVPFPVAPKKPYLTRKHAVEQAEQYAKDLKEYESLMPSFREARMKYREADAALVLQFKNDAFVELGVQDHPKKDLLFSMAWEYGSGNGLSEVWFELQELAQLLQEEQK